MGRIRRSRSFIEGSNIKAIECKNEIEKYIDEINKISLSSNVLESSQGTGTMVSHQKVKQGKTFSIISILRLV